MISAIIAYDLAWFFSADVVRSTTSTNCPFGPSPTPISDSAASAFVEALDAALGAQFHGDAADEQAHEKQLRRARGR